MTRQIEMNFYADVIADKDQQPIAGDLFGVSKDAAPVSMHLENLSNKSPLASISVDVSDNSDSLFND